MESIIIFLYYSY